MLCHSQWINLRIFPQGYLRKVGIAFAMVGELIEIGTGNGVPRGKLPRVTSGSDHLYIKYNRNQGLGCVEIIQSSGSQRGSVLIPSLLLLHTLFWLLLF